MAFELKSMRVDPAWLDRLKEQAAELEGMFKGKRTTSMLMGAAISKFDPVNSKEDRTYLANFIKTYDAGESAARLADSGNLSAAESKKLKALLAKAKG